MSTLPETPHVTFDEWLELEDATEEKHELVGGVLYLMAGSLRRHNLLVTNMTGALLPWTRAQGCRLYNHDMKLRIGETGYYPDLMVVCDPPADERFELAPCLVVEVLSASSKVTDRREKLTAYIGLPSVEAYAIADPDAPRLEIHHRRAGSRFMSVVLGPGDDFELPCPRDAVLAVDELYDGVG